MAKEQDLIKSKLDLYENAQDIFFDSLGKTERSILKSIMGKIDKVDTVDGKLQNNLSSLQLINSLNKEVLSIIRKSTYTDRIDDYLRNFDRMEKLNKELVEKKNDIKLSKVNVNSIKTAAVEDLSIQLAKEDSIVSNLVIPIKEVLFESITTGMTMKEAKAKISEFIAGDENRLGIARRWVGQIARDALTQYDGLVNDIIAKEYGLNAFEYVGSLVEDSRPQCVRWVGIGTLPMSTLPSEIAWAKSGRGGGSLKPPAPNKKGATGMIPLTTVETFARYRGGYNCRHVAIPVRIDEDSTQSEE